MFEYRFGDEMKNNDEIGRTCGMYGEREKRIQGFCIGKTEGKRKIRRRKLRWKNIKLHFKVTKWQSVNWVYIPPGYGYVQGIS